MKIIQWMALLCVFFILFGCTVIDERYTTKRVKFTPVVETEETPVYYGPASYYESYPYYSLRYSYWDSLWYSPHFWMGLSWMGMGYWWNPFWYMNGFWNYYYHSYYPWYWGSGYYPAGKSTITKRQLKRPRRITLPTKSKIRSSKGRTTSGKFSVRRARSSPVTRVRSGTSSRRSSGSRSSGSRVRKK